MCSYKYILTSTYPCKHMTKHVFSVCVRMCVCACMCVTKNALRIINLDVLMGITLRLAVQICDTSLLIPHAVSV